MKTLPNDNTDVELLSRKTGEHPRKTGRLKRLFRSPAFLLAITAFLLAFAVQSGELGSADTVRRLQTTHSFWTSEPAVLPQDYPEFGLHGRHGKLYGWYGMGQSLLMLPADIAGSWLEEAGIFDQYHEEPTIRSIVVSYGTSILIAVLVSLVCYRMLELLGFTVEQRIAGVLALLLGTTFLHYTQNMMENNYIMLLTLTGLTFQYEWLLTGRRRALLIGSATLGLNLLTRLTTGMDMIAVGLFLLLVLWFRGVRGRALLLRFASYAKIALPVYALFGLIDRLYQWYRFGSFFNTYLQVYGREWKMLKPALPAEFPFETPFRVGFLGPLITPEKSIFLFDPLLVLAIVGALLLWRRFTDEIRAYLLAFGALLLAYICFYAKYTVWSGDHAWGDRYVSTAVQLAAFISVPLWLRHRPAVNRWVWRAGLALVAISVAIQLASVAFWCPLEIYQREMLGRPTCVVALRFQNIVAVASGKNPWGITPDSIEDPWDYAHITTFNFLPFLLHRVGAAARWVVEASFALWFAALAGVVGMLVVLQRKVCSAA
jgi:hypothetical protein